MTLVVDSGSTKTEWYLITPNETITFRTKGVNPYYQTSEEISQTLDVEYKGPREVHQIHFYGAGCNSPKVNNIVLLGLKKVFACDSISINSDLLAAARALFQHAPGIACILGTGSNSCVYSNGIIQQNVSPLGYILGDEASGAVLGKRFLGDVLKNQLPSNVKEAFFQAYGNDPFKFISAVYKEPFPNRYLAQLSTFIVNYLHVPEIEAMILDEFRRFIKRNVLQYPEHKNLPISFVGSIAFYYKEQLQTVLKEFDLSLGLIVKSPMEGLVQFHKNLAE